MRAASRAPEAAREVALAQGPGREGVAQLLQAVLHERDGGDGDAERGAYLVRDAGDEAAERGQLLAPHQLALGLVDDRVELARVGVGGEEGGLGAGGVDPAQDGEGEVVRDAVAGEDRPHGAVEREEAAQERGDPEPLGRAQGGDPLDEGVARLRVAVQQQRGVGPHALGHQRPRLGHGSIREVDRGRVPHPRGAGLDDGLVVDRQQPAQRHHRFVHAGRGRG
ncbi:hypothetical protein OV079_39580 [Nannocystis pusilla]|uniref:Uncharacterized protein n=1 Tax=Nannocystis pusilla TaxID=889268 RepID=A0A9X3J2A9_9BACT|nr:hypothetical protein [Nannocystis pusilla]MCY1011564.1 hypothetical protein [Nannocystis pusilla]